MDSFSKKWKDLNRRTNFDAALIIAQTESRVAVAEDCATTIRVIVRKEIVLTVLYPAKKEN